MLDGKLDEANKHTIQHHVHLSAKRHLLRASPLFESENHQFGI